MDDIYALAGLQSVQNSDILCEYSLDSDKKRIEPCIIEALADTAAGHDLAHPLARSRKYLRAKALALVKLHRELVLCSDDHGKECDLAARGASERIGHPEPAIAFALVLPEALASGKAGGNTSISGKTCYQLLVDSRVGGS
jgi:hypothetical protein